MPKAASSRSERVRLSLEVSPELNDKLDELSDKIHGSKSDVLRRAVALMDIAVRARDAGHKLGIAEQNQPLLTEIIGI